MKLLLTFVALFGMLEGYAQSKIENWKTSYKMLQTDAALALENYYSRDAIWDDEGFYCGGDFSNIKLISKTDERYLVAGNVTYAQNYCQYTSMASFIVELYAIEEKIEVNEIEFSENN